MALVSDEVQTIPTVIPEVIQRSSTCSLTTLRGFLSSRRPTNFECRNLSPSVHSRNSICATASGFNQTAFVIFLPCAQDDTLMAFCWVSRTQPWRGVAAQLALACRAPCRRAGEGGACRRRGRRGRGGGQRVRVRSTCARGRASGENPPRGMGLSG